MKYKRFTLIGTIILLILSVSFFTYLPQTTAGTTNFGQTTPILSGNSNLANPKGAKYTTTLGGLVDSISAYLYSSEITIQKLGNTATSGTSYSSSIMNNIVGLRVQTPSSKIGVQSITAYISCTTPTKNMKAAIYTDEGALVAESIEKSISASTSSQTFDFASPPILEASTYYELVIYSQSTTGTAVLYANSNTDINGRSASGTYPTFPYVNTWTTSTYNYRIYCTYTTTLAQCAIYSSTGTSLSPFAKTTEIPIFTVSTKWVTFPFATKPVVSTSTDYVLMAWCSSSNVKIYFASGGSAEGYLGSGTYATWPLTVSDQSYVRQYCIYATVHSSYTLTPSAGANGAITPNTPQTINYGNTPSFTITPNNGYTILDVQVDSVSVLNNLINNVYTFPSITSNHAITVSFTLNNHLIINVVGSGSIVKTPDQANYVSGSTVILQANAATGYSFSGWSGDFVGTPNPYILTIDTTPSITATFTQDNYILNVGVYPSEAASAGCSATGSGSYHLSDTAHCTANAVAGWTFAGWTGDYSGMINPCDLATNENSMIEATFTRDKQHTTLEVMSNPASIPTTGGTIMIIATLKSGDQPLAGKSVKIECTLSVGGTLQATLLTNTEGQVKPTFNVPDGQPYGSFYVITATFDGDNQYTGQTSITTNDADGGGLMVAPEYIIGALAPIGACFAGFTLIKKRGSFPSFRRK